jgi:hypothetical protein
MTFIFLPSAVFTMFSPLRLLGADIPLRLKIWQGLSTVVVMGMAMPSVPS